jgi:spore maturation protein CgeB
LKILIIGSDYNWSIERIYTKELLKLGHEVKHIPVQNWYYDFYYKSKLHKTLTRLGLTRLQSKIQKRLIAEIQHQVFDLIWVFKGMEIQPKTLLELKKQTKRLINFNPDNPFIFSGKGSGNKNVTRGIPLYDEHFTYDHEVRNQIDKEFGIKCTLIPFGFDQETALDNDTPLTQDIKAVCFVGNPDAYRAEILKVLLDNGFPLHVYGNDWYKFLVHPNLTNHGPTYQTEYYQTLRKYRVQLNIMRVHNLDSHNMRSMEIPGCGGLMLAPKTKDHLAFFEEGKEAFFYENSAQLISQVKIMFELEDSAVQKMRLNAREKVLNQFSYKKLTKIFISE